MNIQLINIILRVFQLIPILFVFYSIFCSYWKRKNNINGLRKTRLVLLVLFGAIIISNFYFLIFSLFVISRANPFNQLFVVLEKIINLIAYWLLFYLFSHARKH